MILEPKFSIDEKVWVIDREIDKTIECGMCKGKGKMYDYIHTPYKCHKCWGEGKIEIDILVSRKAKITRIDITIVSNSYMKKNNFIEEKIDYRYTTDLDVGVGVCEPFRTKEEAEKYLSERKYNE